jgi:hypothetical protein
MPRLPTDQPKKEMEAWESGPLWALGLSNGLNIVLWYVLSMARIESPELPIGIFDWLPGWLPLIVAVGGIAQAAALDGALIATIAGARHGRRGIWTWLTIIGACLFSAAISYAVHSGNIDNLPGLHVASAIILGLYNAHLAQPRKALQSADQSQATGDHWQVRDKPPIALPETASQSTIETTAQTYRCRICGEPFEALTDVSKHARIEHPKSLSI